MLFSIWAVAFIAFTFGLYKWVGVSNIVKRYEMFFNPQYWINYNTIEFAAWMAKAIIIIPGLIFKVELWWGHWITLLTSSLLIWASMKKSLPTLILFNTIWIGISLLVLIRHYIG
jgi:hypothetical protein